ncbi:hypothetical protein [Actinomadura sp. SCN-SB]|uniref:hypothetical protein n=1 Tax=Actinomadura sp. SCN-SB TaxID=3373092 RepID=UPI00374FEF82
MARDLKPCGTTAAYQRHLRRGETPCDACREASNAENRGSERHKQWGRARMRALVALSEIYPDVYNALFDEEKRKEGL